MNLIISFLVFLVNAKIDRISDLEFNLSTPQALYMTPGRSTVLDFPCDIESSILGLHNDIKVEIGPNTSRSLVIWLSHDYSEPTNLIIRCDRKVFVIDIYPSKRNHQDYINIKDYKTSEKYEFISKKLINSSLLKNEDADTPKKIKLISTSKLPRGYK